MKRYDPDDDGFSDFIESTQGSWLRFEDVVSLLKKLRSNGDSCYDMDNREIVEKALEDLGVTQAEREDLERRMREAGL